MDAKISQATLDDVMDLLGRLHERLDGFVDVEDGSYGEPSPNWAMRLQTEIDQVTKRVEKEERAKELRTVLCDISMTAAGVL